MYMKVNKSIEKLLANKMVLNVVFVLSLLNIIGNLMIGNFEATMYFILIGLLMTFFSKNMTVILGVPLVLVNLYAVRYNVRYAEGFVEGMKNDKEVATAHKKGVKKAQKKEKFEVGRAKKNKIMYSDTIEKSYDDLSNILGEGGIQGLTQDTQSLIEQQKQLTEAMAGLGKLTESMGPIMKSIGPMMGAFSKKKE
jgi:ABC-type uncharacterized transport system fused permease/ATPase subunit